MVTISTADAADSRLRQVMRDSSGNIVAVLDNQAIEAYISTDDGSTWSGGQVTSSSPRFDGNHDTVVDSTDTFHTVHTNVSDTSQTLYQQWTIDTNGTITTNVTDELVYDSATSFEDAPVDSSAITVDSTDTIYASAYEVERIKGTNYSHPRLFERTGTDSWSDLGALSSGGETNYDNAVVVCDGNDDVQSLFETSSGPYWNKYDTSAGTFAGQEDVNSDLSSGLNGVGAPIIKSDDNGMVFGAAEAVTNGTGYLGIKSGPTSSDTWSWEQYSDQDVVPLVSVTFGGTDVYVVYEANQDVYENHAALGSFDATAWSGVATTADDEQAAVTRWQFNNENDPSTDIVDIVYHDATNQNLEYTSISTGDSTAETHTQVLDERLQLQKD